MALPPWLANKNGQNGPSGQSVGTVANNTPIGHAGQPTGKANITAKADPRKAAIARRMQKSKK